jgi:hypothetical protein
MSWFRIKRPDVNPELRELFEQRGLDTVRAYVTMPEYTMRKRDGALVEHSELRPAMLAWLKEQYDKNERKSNWSLLMEVSITIFVLAELCTSLVSCKPKHNFVSAGIKDLPLLVFDQATSKVCFAGAPPMPPAYMNWIRENVSPEQSPEHPYYCSDVASR